LINTQRRLAESTLIRVTLMRDGLRITWANYLQKRNRKRSSRCHPSWDPSWQSLPKLGWSLSGARSRSSALDACQTQKVGGGVNPFKKVKYQTPPSRRFEIGWTWHSGNWR
jgi:hypothetical protein